MASTNQNNNNNNKNTVNAKKNQPNDVIFA